MDFLSWINIQHIFFSFQYYALFDVADILNRKNNANPPWHMLFLSHNFHNKG